MHGRHFCGGRADMPPLRQQLPAPCLPCSLLESVAPHQSGRLSNVSLPGSQTQDTQCSCAQPCAATPALPIPTAPCAFRCVPRTCTWAPAAAQVSHPQRAPCAGGVDASAAAPPDAGGGWPCAAQLMHRGMISSPCCTEGCAFSF